MPLNANTYLNTSLSCVKLFYVGPLRGYMKRCYREACDDIDHVNEEKVQFLAKV